MVKLNIFGTDLRMIKMFSVLIVLERFLKTIYLGEK